MTHNDFRPFALTAAADEISAPTREAQSPLTRP
jgi:hypothetical protein